MSPPLIICFSFNKPSNLRFSPIEANVNMLKLCSLNAISVDRTKCIYSRYWILLASSFLPFFYIEESLGDNPRSINDTKHFLSRRKWGHMTREDLPLCFLTEYSSPSKHLIGKRLQMTSWLKSAQLGCLPVNIWLS